MIEAELLSTSDLRQSRGWKIFMATSKKTLTQEEEELLAAPGTAPAPPVVHTGLSFKSGVTKQLHQESWKHYDRSEKTMRSLPIGTVFVKSTGPAGGGSRRTETTGGSEGSGSRQTETTHGPGDLPASATVIEISPPHFAEFLQLPAEEIAEGVWMDEEERE